jgi:hypothetical protein
MDVPCSIADVRPAVVHGGSVSCAKCLRLFKQRATLLLSAVVSGERRWTGRSRARLKSTSL